MCLRSVTYYSLCFFFQAEDGIRDLYVTGVQTCALPILAYRVGQLGLTFPAVMSAANEVAVLAFLEGKIPLTRIIEIVQGVVDEHQAPASVVSVVNLERADSWARQRAAEIIEAR